MKPRPPSRKPAKSSARADREYPFDVCLSFAGEQRNYVKRVANRLTKKGARVFFDEYKQVELWGKDLYAHLDDVYRNSARYCVIFASKQYEKKLWSNHERRSAQARALSENREYILPARFDSTEIPGLLPTIGYVNLKNTSASKLADMIVEKLRPRQRENFLPPNPDRLYRRLGAKSDKQKEVIFSQAQVFVEALGGLIRKSAKPYWPHFGTVAQPSCRRISTLRLIFFIVSPDFLRTNSNGSAGSFGLLDLAVACGQVQRRGIDIWANFRSLLLNIIISLIFPATSLLMSRTRWFMVQARIFVKNAVKLR